jgi:Flp pilus assembly protein TadB
MDEALKPGVPSGMREYHEPRTDAREVDEVAREEMAQHSPDGRQPDVESRGRGRKVFVLVLAVGLPLVIGGVIYWGGMAALGMGLVYVLVFAFVAFPVWYAGLMRRREESEATEIVKHTLGERGERDDGGRGGRERAA